MLCINGMENESCEKNHPPSQRKLKHAREKGDVPLSRELVGATVFLAGILLLGTFAPRLVFELLNLVKKCLYDQVDYHFATERLMVMLSIILLPLAAVTLVVSLSQSGFLFRPKFDFSRINPAKGLKNIFSRQRIFDLFLSFMKFNLVFVLAGSVAAILVTKSLGADGNLASGTVATGKALFFVLVAMASAGLAFGGLDLLLQRRRYLKRLRMSRQELLQELKEQEGDPHIKSERKRLHRQLGQGVGLGSMTRARLVVVNPTHIAVALAYREGRDQAPWVVVSGWGEKAVLIRREALRLNIPVVEQVELARSLILLEWGEEIPEELYQATADLILALEEAERLSPRGGPKSGQLA